MLNLRLIFNIIFLQATFALAKVLALHASCIEKHQELAVATDYNKKLPENSLKHLIRYTNYPLPYINCKPCQHPPLKHPTSDVVNQYVDSSHLDHFQNTNEASQAHVSLIFLNTLIHDALERS